MATYTPENIADRTPPVSVSEAMRHLRIDNAYEEDTAEAYLIAAWQRLENDTSTFASPCQVVCRSAFGPVELLGGDVALDSVVVEYLNKSQVWQTLVLDTDYRIRTAPWPYVQFIEPPSDADPDEGYPVRVTYDAGPVSPHPWQRQAILLLTGTYYENRESESEARLGHVPNAYNALISAGRGPSFFQG